MGNEVARNHERNAGNFVILARALWAQEDYDRAALALKTAFDVYQAIGPGLPPEAINVLAVWGEMYMDQAEEDHSLPPASRTQRILAARLSLQRALEGAEHYYLDNHPVMGGILAALAKAYGLEGNVSNSQRERSRAEAIRSENLQAGDLEAATRFSAQGTNLVSHGLYDEADLYLDRALKIREDLSYAQDFDSSAILLKLGALYRLQRSDSRARLPLERALTIRIEVCGEPHPATQIVKNTLALLDN